MTKVITEIPDLVNYWDFDKNNKLNIETLTITSTKISNWRCPSCYYEWRASISKTYKQFQNEPNLCPVCDLGEVLVKEINSIYKRFPNFINYINFHHEDYSTIPEEICNLSFSSKRLFHFKCPTCFTSWVDVANSSRLMRKSDNTIIHKDCNKFTNFIPYTKAYPNLKKIYHVENDVEFESLKLDDNVTLSKKWKCDKCEHSFELPIDRLISKIKRNGYYCTKCKATFDTTFLTEKAPMAYTDRHLVDELVQKKHIKKNMIDSLSNIVVTWKCLKCNGRYDCAVFEKHQKECPYCSNKQMLKGYNTLKETHPYLEKFWNEENEKTIDDYWYKTSDSIDWKCPCCNIDFQCRPSELISRTNLENSNFETCPNKCDWDSLVFNNDIFHDSPNLHKEWSSKNGIPVHLALSHIETKKYWWNCSCCGGEYLCSIPIRREVENTCPYCNDELPLKGVNTVLDKYPNLLNYWSEKNSQKLDQITESELLNNKFIWICECCNLESEQKIAVSQSKYSTLNKKDFIIYCPYCTKKIPKPHESLAAQKPFLKCEWLENINGDINKFFYNSYESVEWVCRKCHRNFKACIGDRSKDDNCCPYCSKKSLAIGYNDLETTHPWLIKEWSGLNERNISSVMESTNYRAWWKCSVCSGEYQEFIEKKLSQQESCPYCKNLKALKGYNDLGTTHPWLIKEWSNLNERDISSVMESSSYNAWWKCSSCSGVYQQSVNKRLHIESPCPYCNHYKALKGYNDLGTTHPWLIKEWSDFNERDISSVMESSSYNAWWKCSSCSGEYQQSVNKRVNIKDPCPYCNHYKALKGYNDLGTTHQYLMDEWDYLNNILLANPTEITERSQLIVWWICKDNPQHRYKLKVKDRVNFEKRSKNSCTICKGLRRKQEHFVQYKM